MKKTMRLLRLIAAVTLAACADRSSPTRDTSATTKQAAGVTQKGGTT